MSRLHGLATRLRLLFARRAAEARMEEEFRFHLDMETERHVRAGLTADEARRRATHAFGVAEAHREEMRDGRTVAPRGGWTLDVTLGLRMLVKYPGLAIVGGLGMALATAIGAGAHAVYRGYIRPELPLHEGSRVVFVANSDPRIPGWADWMPADVATLRRELRSIRDVGAFRTVRRNLILANGSVEPVPVAEMTASGFRVARVPPLLGRPLLDADEQPGAPPVVVIGHAVWTSRFGADPTVVGRAIRLGRVTHTVVGVMPAGFAFPVHHDWWVPLRVDPTAAAIGRAPTLLAFGRLAPGVTRDVAKAELVALRRGMDRSPLFPYAHPYLPTVHPYTSVVYRTGDETRDDVAIPLVLSMLLVLVALNVAVLVYARTVTRQAEIAVRSALGASRARIVAQLFAEALVLSTLSALAGLGFVHLALRWVDGYYASIAPTGRLPFWVDPGLSWSAAAWALGLAVVAALIVGVLPALRATGAQLRPRMAGLDGGARAQLGRTWTACIVAQVAVAVMALPPALVVARPPVEAALQEPGFAVAEYLAATLVVDVEPRTGADTVRAARELSDTVRALESALLARLASEPAVAGATLAARYPGGEWDERFDVEGGASNVSAGVNLVDARYFDLFDARLLAGRQFHAADAAIALDHRPVVVTRSFVREHLGGAAALGRRIRDVGQRDTAAPWREIVGVVEDFPAGYRSGPRASSARVFRLAAPGDLRGALLMVRLRGQSPASFAPTLRRLGASVDPALQFPHAGPLTAAYEGIDRQRGLVALVAALLAGSVLLLSAAGIHALMSFTVFQRRREIGVRAALGAGGGRVLAAVLARAAGQLAAGVSVGLALASWVEWYSGGKLMEGDGRVIVPSIAVFFVVVGLLAAAGPARRGLRVPPTEALRADG